MTTVEKVSETVLLRSEGAVRVVTLNRPDELNAVNADLHHGVATVWRKIAEDPDARAAVITGAGRAFCAGGDLKWFSEVYGRPGFLRQLLAQASDLVREMVRCPLPIVAAVNGPAVGLGCSLAVHSDIVLMAESAFLADTHVAVGLVAGDGGAASWPAFVSLLKAKEYLFTGDRIPAREAERLGLANRVVPDEELMGEAMSLAHRLAALPAQALQDTKRALNLHLERMMSGVLEFALSAEAESFMSEEHQRIAAAFARRSQAGDGG